MVTIFVIKRVRISISESTRHQEPKDIHSHTFVHASNAQLARKCHLNLNFSLSSRDFNRIRTYASQVRHIYAKVKAAVAKGPETIAAGSKKKSISHSARTQITARLEHFHFLLQQQQQPPRECDIWDVFASLDQCGGGGVFVQKGKLTCKSTCKERHRKASQAAGLLLIGAFITQMKRPAFVQSAKCPATDANQHVPNFSHPGADWPGQSGETAFSKNY